MKLFCEFDNHNFGTYDVILHASEAEMRVILDHFGEPDAIPDVIPAERCKYKEDLYLFLADSAEHVITPLWSVNYAYGHMYNGYGPVGADLPDFEMDLSRYSFRMFTPVDERQIKENGLPREEWPDRQAAERRKMRELRRNSGPGGIGSEK